MPQIPSFDLNNIEQGKAVAKHLIQSGHFDEAIRILSAVCARHNNDPESWFLLGALHGQKEDYPEAEKCCRNALALQNKHAGLHYNLAIALYKQGKSRESEQFLLSAIALNPNYTEALLDLGMLYAGTGRLEQAITQLELAIQKRNDILTAHVTLCRLLLQSYRFERLKDRLEHALRLFPDSTELHYLKGLSHQEQGDIGNAIPCFERVLEIDPVHEDARASLAATHGLKGNHDVAQSYLDPLITSPSPSATTCLVFSIFAHRFDREDEAIRNLQQKINDPTLDVNNLAKMHFALAGIYDRRESHDLAFEHYATGNRLRGAIFNRDHLDQSVTALIDVFTKDWLKDAPRATATGRSPIFIVGMPRSGTSLVEQILASHPDVYGAGELDLINRYAMGLQDILQTGRAYPLCAPDITSSALNRLAGDYLSAIDHAASGKSRFTDKMPMNYLHLGLIELLFPDAKIVHCTRDPMDNCLSCYFQHFGSEHAYAYDLGDLGFTYKQYRRLMQHWNDNLHIPIMDLNYESLVKDLEGVSRSLLQFCDLSWHDDCLRFHETSRTVATASHDQVKRPIYHSSINRWQHYAKHLGPLQKELSTLYSSSDN